MLISIRRRVLPAAELQILRDHVAAGKPVIGIRTANHAFSLGRRKPPADKADWPEFDAEVFGGSYHGHLGNSLKSTIQVNQTLLHPILRTMSRQPFDQGYSLYNVLPLASGTTVLATGTAAGHPEEPVAWTFQRPDGGRSFYTSAGHPKDFADTQFRQLLLNGIYWSVGLEQPKAIEPGSKDTDAQRHWVNTRIPMTEDFPETVNWLRCILQTPVEWQSDSLQVRFGQATDVDGVFLNGVSAPLNADGSQATLPVKAFVFGEANLLTIRIRGSHPLVRAPRFHSGDNHLPLNGTWQFRTGDDDTLANMPLPSKFGGATDIVFSSAAPLWVAHPVTLPNEFTAGIEGPACDRSGNIYAVNFGRQGTIGKVTPDGAGDIFATLPEGSIGNGIRFDKDGMMLVADYAEHNILRIDPATKQVTKLAHNPKMNQPNDLAIGPDGTLWASDPNWAESTGQIWRIDRNGATTRVAADMGTTNGIEVSPDGTTLYVNESVQRNIWAFTITDQKQLQGKRLFRKFDDFGFDGQRCDVHGNLYVTRYGKGTVVKLSPQGRLLQEIRLPGTRPSNLCFGGPDGRTVYVTEVDSMRLIQFRVDQPGLSHLRWSE